MLVEFIIINSLAPKEDGVSAARYIPRTIYQKKVFNTEAMIPEECLNQKGKVLKQFSIVKEGNDFYKLKYPYEQLKEEYFKPLVIGGLNAKRSNYTNL